MTTQSNTLARSPWFYWAIGALFYLYQFVIRVCPSVMADDWMIWYAIDTALLGSLVALYYASYSLMQIPLGALFDRYGPRVLISLAGLVCAVGCLIISNAHSVYLFGLGRLLMGMGAACGFLGTMKIATLVFPQDKIGTIGGLTTAFGVIGGIIGGAPLSILTAQFDWHFSLNVLAITGVMIALVAWFGLKTISYINDATTTFKGIVSGFKTLLKSGYAWRIALFAFCMYVPLAAFAELWGIPYLKVVYQISEARAAAIMAANLVGLFLGTVLLGGFCRLVGDHKAMIIGGVCSLVFICCAIYLPISPLFTMICLFLSGFFFGPECLAFGRIVEVLPDEKGGLAIGFTNMVTMMSGLIMQPLIGWLLAWMNPGEAGAKLVIDASHYHKALIVVPIALIFATILAISLKPSEK